MAAYKWTRSRYIFLTPLLHDPASLAVREKTPTRDEELLFAFELRFETRLTNAVSGTLSFQSKRSGPEMDADS